MSTFSATLQRSVDSPQSLRSSYLSTTNKRVEYWSGYFPFLETSWRIPNLDTVLKRLHWNKYQYRRLKILSTVSAVTLAFIVLSISGLPVFSLWTLIIFLIAIGAGWFLPDQYLLDAQSNQLVQLNAQVPDFLQLFALSISSSGLVSLSQVLEDISRALTGSLKTEIQHILHKKHFLSQAEILKEVTTLTPHPFLQDLGMILEIHHTYGGQLSTALVDLAHRAQTDRVQHAQELANASSGLLLGPLLLFHLPALLIIVLIPAVLAFTNGI